MSTVTTTTSTTSAATTLDTQTMQEPTHTTAMLQYQVPLLKEKPWVSINEFTDGRPSRNFEEESRKVDVQNIRTTDKAIGIDVTGFDMRKIPSEFGRDHKNYTDDARIRSQYYKEIEKLILDATGGREVYIFDHTIRRRNPGEADDDPGRRQPVPRCHIDQTPKAAADRVKRHMGDRADELLKKRYQLINIWRPIENSADDYPLAVCDYASIDATKDLVPCSLIYPTTEGETYNVTYGAGHRWYYCRGMTVDEVMLIKCFDSKQGVAGLTPHTAFHDPNTRPGVPYRQSIEVRALIFHDA